MTNVSLKKVAHFSVPTLVDNFKTKYQVNILSFPKIHPKETIQIIIININKIFKPPNKDNIVVNLGDMKV